MSVRYHNVTKLNSISNLKSYFQFIFREAVGIVPKFLMISLLAMYYMMNRYAIFRRRAKGQDSKRETSIISRKKIRGVIYDF